MGTAGRADAVFNRLVIEYERPGALGDRLSHRGTSHAVGQVKGYISELARRHRHEMTRVAGIAFDGYHLVFARYREGRFDPEPPVPVNRYSLERFLTWLASLSSGAALTSENLNRDFSIEQLRTRNILRGLFKVLQLALRTPDGMVAKLFEQWRLFFSEAIDYSEAFGGRKLEPLRKWVRKAGIEVGSAAEAEQFFFVLHTYFALLVKLLAWLALYRHLGVKLGGPSFGSLATADSKTLRRHLQEMESGGIFRAYSLLNLLEGDFFSWYLYAWDAPLEEAVREIVKRLDEYDPSTLTIMPEETRDLFKKVYHYLLPREIRHNLGEYYTPDWLAQRLLNQVDNEFFTADTRHSEKHLRHKLLNVRFLDPACGSGTFSVLIIARMLEMGRALLIPEEQLLESILRNVVGFDLNPLAVLTARVNYLLAVTDLLEYRRGDVTIPIYLADSVRAPLEGADLTNHGAYEFPTAVGRFLVPTVLCTHGRFERFCDVLEESLRQELDDSAFICRLERTLNLEPPQWDERAVTMSRELYERMLELHREGLNGLWARLLKNNFAPLTIGRFDYIVGNPPWVNWENLPDEYRQAIKPIWERYGLFPHGGMDAILGKGKKDISMLMSFVVTDRLLQDGGRLGFVITQSVFKTSGAGQGFRRFRIPQGNGKYMPLRVVHVDDMVALNPFEGASNRTTVMVLEKGKTTGYPVPYTVWRKTREMTRFNYDSTLEEVTAATRRFRFHAEPVDEKDETSPWLTARKGALRALRKVIGKSDYQAHAGTYTGGVNAVYWVSAVFSRPDGLVVVRNMTEGAKIKVDEVIEPIEPDLLYPLLRGRDVRRWRAEPSSLILMVQDPVLRRGIGEEELRARYPRTYGYLKRFEKTLRQRPAFRRYFTRRDRDSRIIETGPFYSMFDVGRYTFAEWKVVWPNIASSLEAAVVGKERGRVVIPQHIVTLVACETAEEANYVCALINSLPANGAAKSYSQEGGKSFGDPHVLEHIRIPWYDEANLVHRRLAELSEQAHLAVRAGDKERLRAVEAEIDQQAAVLWDLSEAEMHEIRRSLEDVSDSSSRGEKGVDESPSGSPDDSAGDSSGG
ncbi:MAG: SAM-dependent DNA methyltransferase [Firmicutes bacterium]|nr:SAM-dependent DNA methyltransferase [Bacillota bacterium]